MQRNRLKSLQGVTRTLLPVLIPASEEQAEGGFLEVETGKPKLLRTLTRNELDTRAKDFRKRILEQLTPQQWNLLTGMSSLKIALAKGDEFAAARACSSLAVDPSVARSIDPKWPGLTRDEFAEFLMSQPSEIGRVLATLGLGKILSSARLVYWVSRDGPQLGPAIYCPDVKTAIGVHLLLGDVFRVCPRCQKIFIVKHPRTQMCCSRECTDAHRVARFRARKKTSVKGE